MPFGTLSLGDGDRGFPLLLPDETIRELADEPPTPDDPDSIAAELKRAVDSIRAVVGHVRELLGRNLLHAAESARGTATPEDDPAGH